jgi:signal transduction histidine kinase/DNA-binding response OmpR family regulator
MRRFSLRRILAVSLVLLATVPALLVAWMMSRASTQAVEDLAGKILTQVAALVQTGTEAHLRQAHDVLNALFPERPGAADTERARQWLRQPVLFEPMAFALTRQSADVPVMHFANLHGEYLGVESTPEGTRVGVRPPDGAGRRFYLSPQPGQRGALLAAEDRNFEPRSTPWYAGALEAKGRVFSPVQVSAQRKQLMVSLSQPVYDADGGAAGVFGTDLYLQQLADVLRTQRISARGAAFVVDEKGALVASSAGDALFREDQGRFERRSPRDSANAVIRAGHAALEGLRASRREDSVATDKALQRLPLEGDALLMVQRPFGEALGLRWTLVVAAPESDFTAEIRRAWRASLGVMALLILLGTVIAFLLAHGIGRHLRRLGVAAEQLGRGEVPAAAGPTRIRDVHQLSAVLHDSAEQLQRYRVQVEADARALQQANETLEDRVEQRTAQLAASREEALAAARAKSAFLATMSHEIRTPLNGVVGMSTLLAETPLDAEQRDYLQTIRLSSDQLLAVINDILDFSKIESGKLDLEAEPFSLRGAVEEACDIAAPRAREKGLELIIDLADAGPGAVPAAIAGDVTRLRQVLINLINNAVKFTAAGEVAVHVHMREADDGQGRCVLEFRVTDSGIGIPADRVDSLFQAFTQVDASTTRKYGGTGLGLAICKRLVDLMGGQIGVESELGRGSTFWFTLAAPVARLPQDHVPHDASALTGRRALIVDDHATNIRILARQLQLWGLEVYSVDSAREALSWLAQGEMPDVVVTDMHMPDMDGVALARTLKGHPQWRTVPLVLLSSGFMPAGEENAQLFNARLLKPARQNQLFDTLLRCLASDRALVPAAAAAVGASKDALVLVADDNAVNLKVAGAMLVKLGYGVRTAVDGREAIAAADLAATQGPPLAAILMDVNMPEVDGLEATRRIQARWGDRAPPIIALTAGASAEDRQRCEAAGMDDFLTKPLQVAALAGTLEKWILTAASADVAPAQAVTAPASPISRPAAPVAAALIDFSRLQEFKDYDDDELTMTREVVALCLQDTPSRIEAIADAIAAGDAPALARAAHALKGAAGNIGAVALQQACSTLEEQAQQGMPADAADQARHLSDLWQRTRQELASWA